MFLEGFLSDVTAGQARCVTPGPPARRSGSDTRSGVSPLDHGAVDQTAPQVRDRLRRSDHGKSERGIGQETGSGGIVRDLRQVSFDPAICTPSARQHPATPGREPGWGGTPLGSVFWPDNHGNPGFRHWSRPPVPKSPPAPENRIAAGWPAPSYAGLQRTDGNRHGRNHPDLNPIAQTMRQDTVRREWRAGMTRRARSNAVVRQY